MILMRRPRAKKKTFAFRESSWFGHNRWKSPSATFATSQWMRGTRLEGAGTCSAWSASRSSIPLKYKPIMTLRIWTALNLFALKSLKEKTLRTSSPQIRMASWRNSIGSLSKIELVETLHCSNVPTQSANKCSGQNHTEMKHQNNALNAKQKHPARNARQGYARNAGGSIMGTWSANMRENWGDW